MSSGKVLNSYQFRMNNVFTLGEDFEIFANQTIENVHLSYDLLKNRNNLGSILYKIIEIHLILLNSSQLSNEQKLDYCKVERDLMKQYLKGIIRKK